MSEYKGWHVFMQWLYLPFSKELWLVEVLSTEDFGWALSAAVGMQSATVLTLRRLQAAKENLSDLAVLVVFTAEFCIQRVDFLGRFLQSTLNVTVFCILIIGLIF